MTRAMSWGTSLDAILDDARKHLGLSGDISGWQGRTTHYTARLAALPPRETPRVVVGSVDEYLDRTKNQFGDILTGLQSTLSQVRMEAESARAYSMEVRSGMLSNREFLRERCGVSAIEERLAAVERQLETLASSHEVSKGRAAEVVARLTTFEERLAASELSGSQAVVKATDASKRAVAASQLAREAHDAAALARRNIAAFAERMDGHIAREEEAARVRDRRAAEDVARVRDLSDAVQAAAAEATRAARAAEAARADGRVLAGRVSAVEELPTAMDVMRGDLSRASSRLEALEARPPNVPEGRLTDLADRVRRAEARAVEASEALQGWVPFLETVKERPTPVAREELTDVERVLHSLEARIMRLELEGGPDTRQEIAADMEQKAERIAALHAAVAHAEERLRHRIEEEAQRRGALEATVSERHAQERKDLRGLSERLGQAEEEVHRMTAWRAGLEDRMHADVGALRSEVRALSGVRDQVDRLSEGLKRAAAEQARATKDAEDRGRITAQELEQRVAQAVKELAGLRMDVRDVQGAMERVVEGRRLEGASRVATEADEGVVQDLLRTVKTQGTKIAELREDLDRMSHRMSQRAQEASTRPLASPVAGSVAVAGSSGALATLESDVAEIRGTTEELHIIFTTLRQQVEGLQDRVIETSHGLAALETRVRTLTATSNNDCTLVLLSGQEGANEHEASSMGMPAGSDKGSEGAVVVRLPPANHANEAYASPKTPGSAVSYGGRAPSTPPSPSPAPAPAAAHSNGTPRIASASSVREPRPADRSAEPPMRFHSLAGASSSLSEEDLEDVLLLATPDKTAEAAKRASARDRNELLPVSPTGSVSSSGSPEVAKKSGPEARAGAAAGRGPSGLDRTYTALERDDLSLDSLDGIQLTDAPEAEPAHASPPPPAHASPSPSAAQVGQAGTTTPSSNGPKKTAAEEDLSDSGSLLEIPSLRGAADGQGSESGSLPDIPSLRGDGDLDRASETGSEASAESGSGERDVLDLPLFDIGSAGVEGRDEGAQGGKPQHSRAGADVTPRQASTVSAASDSGNKPRGLGGLEAMLASFGEEEQEEDAPSPAVHPTRVSVEASSPVVPDRRGETGAFVASGGGKWEAVPWAGSGGEAEDSRGSLGSSWRRERGEDGRGDVEAEDSTRGDALAVDVSGYGPVSPALTSPANVMSTGTTAMVGDAIRETVQGSLMPGDIDSDTSGSDSEGSDTDEDAELELEMLPDEDDDARGSWGSRPVAGGGAAGGGPAQTAPRQPHANVSAARRQGLGWGEAASDSGSSVERPPGGDGIPELPTRDAVASRGGADAGGAWGEGRGGGAAWGEAGGARGARSGLAAQPPASDMVIDLEEVDMSSSDSEPGARARMQPPPPPTAFQSARSAQPAPPSAQQPVSDDSEEFADAASAFDNPFRDVPIDELMQERNALLRLVGSGDPAEEAMAEDTIQRIDHELSLRR